MNVLSLFDGMSCGQIALERCGYNVANYFASEIDKYAIKVTMANYPKTRQVGDVCFINPCNFPKIDLILVGSPCQGFSFAGKGLNFSDPRSALFFEFVRILSEVKIYNPDVKFLLENVVMKKKYQDVISDILGVQPIMINSALVSAQNRRRLYWTNIEGIEQPKDRGINLIDILDDTDKSNPSAIRGRYINKATIVGRRINEEGYREDYNKKIPITQCLEVRKTNTNKSNCITTVQKDNVLTNLPYGRHIDVYGRNLPYRYYSLKELCRLQTVPDNYFKLISENQAKKMLGNGWTVDVIAHILSYLK